MFYSDVMTNVQCCRKIILLIFIIIITVNIIKFGEASNHGTHHNHNHNHHSDTTRFCPDNKPPINWASGLRESIYRALIRSNDNDYYLQNHLHNLPIIHLKINQDQLFGDIVQLAKGQIYQTSDKDYKIIQDNCDDAAETTFIDNTYDEIIGLWTVERVRHHRHYGYEFEFHYKIILRNPYEYQIIKYNGQNDYSLPGHLYIIRLCKMHENVQWSPSYQTTKTIKWNSKTNPTDPTPINNNNNNKPPSYSVWVHRNIPKINDNNNQRVPTINKDDKDLHSHWIHRDAKKLNSLWIHKNINRHNKTPSWHQNIDFDLQNTHVTIDQNGIKHIIRYPEFSPEIKDEDIFGELPPSPPPTMSSSTQKLTTLSEEDFLNFGSSTKDNKEIKPPAPNYEQQFDELFNFSTTTRKNVQTTSMNPNISDFLSLDDFIMKRKTTTRSFRKMPSSPTLPSFILPDFGTTQKRSNQQNITSTTTTTSTTKDSFLNDNLSDTFLSEENVSNDLFPPIINRTQSTTTETIFTLDNTTTSSEKSKTSTERFDLLETKNFIEKSTSTSTLFPINDQSTTKNPNRIDSTMTSPSTFTQKTIQSTEKFVTTTKGTLLSTQTNKLETTPALELLPPNRFDISTTSNPLTSTNQITSIQTVESNEILTQPQTTTNVVENTSKLKSTTDKNNQITSSEKFNATSTINDLESTKITTSSSFSETATMSQPSEKSTFESTANNFDEKITSTKKPTTRYDFKTSTQRVPTTTFEVTTETQDILKITTQKYPKTSPTTWRDRTRKTTQATSSIDETIRTTNQPVRTTTWTRYRNRNRTENQTIRPSYGSDIFDLGKTTTRYRFRNRTENQTVKSPGSTDMFNIDTSTTIRYRYRNRTENPILTSPGSIDMFDIGETTTTRYRYRNRTENQTIKSPGSSNMFDIGETTTRRYRYRNRTENQTIKEPGSTDMFDIDASTTTRYRYRNRTENQTLKLPISTDMIDTNEATTTRYRFRNRTEDQTMKSTDGTDIDFDESTTTRYKYRNRTEEYQTMKSPGGTDIDETTSTTNRYRNRTEYQTMRLPIDTDMIETTTQLSSTRYRFRNRTESETISTTINDIDETTTQSPLFTTRYRFGNKTESETEKYPSDKDEKTTDNQITTMRYRFKNRTEDQTIRSTYITSTANVDESTTQYFSPIDGTTRYRFGNRTEDQTLRPPESTANIDEFSTQNQLPTTRYRTKNQTENQTIKLTDATTILEATTSQSSLFTTRYQFRNRTEYQMTIPKFPPTIETPLNDISTTDQTKYTTQRRRTDYDNTRKPSSKPPKRRPTSKYPQRNPITSYTSRKPTNPTKFNEDDDFLNGNQLFTRGPTKLTSEATLFPDYPQILTSTTQRTQQVTPPSEDDFLTPSSIINNSNQNLFIPKGTISTYINDKRHRKTTTPRQRPYNRKYTTKARKPYKPYGTSSLSTFLQPPITTTALTTSTNINEEDFATKFPIKNTLQPTSDTITSTIPLIVSNTNVESLGNNTTQTLVTTTEGFQTKQTVTADVIHDGISTEASFKNKSNCIKCIYNGTFKNGTSTFIASSQTVYLHHTNVTKMKMIPRFSVSTPKTKLTTTTTTPIPMFIIPPNCTFYYYNNHATVLPKVEQTLDEYNTITENTTSTTSSSTTTRQPFIPRQPRYRKFAVTRHHNKISNQYLQDLDALSNTHFYLDKNTKNFVTTPRSSHILHTEKYLEFRTSQSISTSVSINVGKK